MMVTTVLTDRESDIFSGHGVEIVLHSPSDFLKIVETLTRIGIPSYRDKKLFQSCHILHKRGRYVIIHFLELFLLDGKRSSFSREDELRRNVIVKILEGWGLFKIIPSEKKRMLVDEGDAGNMRIKIISFRDKGEWELVAKHSIGRVS